MNRALFLMSAICAVSAFAEPAGPGSPVPSPAAEKQATAILGQLANPAAKPAPAWKSIICGPLVWKKLASKEPALAAKGVRTHIMKPGQSGPGQDARTFAPGHGDADFYASAAVQQLAKTFAAGKTRSATQKEREAFYAVYPFEIKGQPVTLVDAGPETMAVFADKDNLWLDLFSPSANAGATTAPAVAASSAPAQSVKDVYTGDNLRDPFQRLGARGVVTKAFSPEDFSIHNLTLRGVMKDRAADYALFTENTYGISFILRRGKLYDAKGHTVQGVTGSMNLRQKTAFLKTAESDVQTFKLGETGKD